MRDYLTKQDNTAPLPQGILSADEDNVRFEELKQAVLSAGISLDPVGGPTTDNAMLAQAMAKYASGGVFCVDAGISNAYVLGLTSTFKPPKAYFHGLRVGWMPGGTSTGASTLNAFALGIKKLLRPDATVIQAGDVFANRYAEAWYDAAADSGAGAFRLVPWAIPVTPVGGGTAQSGEGVSVDGTYHVSLNYPGLGHNPNPTANDLFSYYNTADGHHRYLTKAELLALFAVNLQHGLLNVQVITASGTYTKTAGCTAALVFATGAGGAGGVCYSCAGGGGAGATGIAFVDLSLTSTVACTVGAGGAGVATSSHNSAAGGSGGATAFGSYAVASGGQGGPGSPTGGLGGSASAGALRLTGGDGDLAAQGLYHNGSGGASFWGGGGAGCDYPAINGGTGVGYPGRAYGSGGGGADSAYSTGRKGGDGAPGVIFVLEF
jgi:hypothetical protein